MAYELPFNDYQPHPSGNGYLFQHQNGNQYWSYGPGAEQLRTQIDRSKPKDRRLAMNDKQAIQQAMQDVQSAPAQAPTQVVPGGSLSMQMPVPQQENPLAQYASQVDPHDIIKAQQGQAKDRAPVAKLEELPPDLQAMAQQHSAPFPAGASEAPAPTNHVNEPPGKVVAPSGQLPMMRGGAAAGAAPPQAPGMSISPVKYVPGRNPAAEAANAVAVPTAQSVVTEGGIQDPEARKAAVDAFHAQVEAQKNLAKVQEDSATAQLEQQRADLLEAQQRQGQAEQEIANQQARQTVLRQEYDKRMAAAQQDYDTASKKEVDQYRIFKGNTGAQLSGVLAVLGSAMGAAGSAYGHGTPNYALQSVNRMLDNDIEAQRDEIHRGVAKSSNDLQRIATQYNMDYDDAASVLKMNYARAAEAALAKKAALNGTLQAKQAFAQVQPQFQAWMADEQAKMQARLNGQVKTVQEARMVTPTRGGFVPKTDEEITKEYERGARRAVAESTMTHGGQKPGAQAAEKMPGEVTPQLSRVAVAADTALESLYDLRKKVESSAHIGPLDVGRIGQSIARGGADTDIAAAVNHADQAIAAAETPGGTKPDQERAHELGQKLGSMNRAQQLTHIDALIEQMQRKRNTIRDVSAKTARVGSISAPSEGGPEE